MSAPVPNGDTALQPKTKRDENNKLQSHKALKRIAGASVVDSRSRSISSMVDAGLSMAESLRKTAKVLGVVPDSLRSKCESVFVFHNSGDELNIGSFYSNVQT